MSSRSPRARLHSLCGTARRMRKAELPEDADAGSRRPCRHSAIWACQGEPQRRRRLAQQSR